MTKLIFVSAAAMRNISGRCAAYVRRPSQWSVLSCEEYGFRGETRIFCTPKEETGVRIETSRQKLLQEQLEKLSIDSAHVHAAAESHLVSPLSGYDGRYGKSALRAYMTFLYPRAKSVSHPPSMSAAHCARQIEFLMKRHQSHQRARVRHTDIAGVVRKSHPIIIVLDNLRSAENVGSIWRTAEACGCVLVIACGIAPHPLGNGGEKIQKTALGAEKLLSSMHFATTAESMMFLREEYPSYQLVGVETTNLSISYTRHTYPSPVMGAGVAVYLGNEVTGIDARLLSDFDVMVEIPMFGSKNSLNVAACASVILYEIIRQWQVA